MKGEDEIKTHLDEKSNLLAHLRESLSADLNDREIDIHPAVLAQWHYIKALKWVLELDE